MRVRVTEAGTSRMVDLAGDRVVIGRDPECDLALEDSGVSRRHAQLTRTRDGWEVRDLGSRNGTFVNEQPAERATVRPDDAIGIGPDVRIEVVSDDATEDEPVETAEAIARPERGRAPGRAGNWFQHVLWRLEPSRRDATDVILRSGATMVGRDPGAGLVLDDESVSRMHARLVADARQLTVTDLKSRNGTHVNDHAVMQAPLEPGDMIRFGDVEFTLLRSVAPAWTRIALVAALIAGVAVAGVFVGQLSDLIGERSAIAGTSKRMRQQALENTRAGIAASRAGDPELARDYLIHAADLLFLGDLAPRGTTPDRPAEFFRDLIAQLPEADRDFDFTSALDPAAISSSRARLSTLTNREYVEHQLRRYAVELNQDPDVPRAFVERVWGFVQQHENYPGSMRAMLRRSRDVQPRIRSILSMRHLPEAFCYVAWVESGLDPMQLSPVGALGLWQLMPSTARELGLTVSQGDLRANVGLRRGDQRTDIERSTAAAADYIGRLLRDQGPEHFMLVLASYNRGPGAVDRAKQKVDDPMLSGTKKFWYLSEHGLLPVETRDYVPRILAVRLIAEAPQRFGFEKP